ncbi:hypothetical protein SDC9_179773 [bioreactor metagenome]|uniref:FeoB-associated Cys-rich membrane protein n=1 Tax=bioreactor metagenome TaxID=1076179 RepID=A0A645GZQ9_9ZZZZ
MQVFYWIVGIALIVFAFYYVIRFVIRSARGEGCGSCSGGCAGCPAKGCRLRKAEETTEDKEEKENKEE